MTPDDRRYLNDLRGKSNGEGLAISEGLGENLRYLKGIRKNTTDFTNLDFSEGGPGTFIKYERNNRNYLVTTKERKLILRTGDGFSIPGLYTDAPAAYRC